ncbi:hypothetical protein FNH22_25280 [Fulvivirga sp. M361]|uniref:hypothetical protein n=1 Tax=Fulvivirga sp. M361 TaxID=2594266 RepID=UPI00117B94C0|nr:hypothetical protein [Fulvivirga sp. M361]TRX50637.1 hypothetical protein FNH22_25280 [Fulvivirga sp. M361]
MKKILLLSFSLLIVFTSCEIIIEEPVLVYDYRNDFTGYYQVDEYSETFDSYAEYPVRIVKSDAYDESVYLENFYGVGIHVIADVDGTYLYIPGQEVDGYYIEGEGRLDGYEITLTYSVTDYTRRKGNTDFCSSVAWK